MESLACLNGELLPVDQARVPVWDRGFLFGDAIYEVLRIYGGRCWLEDDHFARLRRSLDAMRFPHVDLHALAARMHRTIAASGIAEGTAYLHVTRGVAPRSHAFPDPPVPPTELIVIRVYDDGPTARLREAGVAAIGHPDWRWGRCDVKSTNLLANVIAHDAAHRAGGFEAILVDRDGMVTEATHNSLLWVRGGRVHATPEGHPILPGTTRHHLLGLIGEIGLEFSEAREGIDALIASDEVMLSGTTTEVLSVVRIDGKDVAGGRPGPVARRLHRAYRDAVGRWLAPQPA